jgi:tetratricopeptide (TPR) repeat protein
VANTDQGPELEYMKTYTTYSSGDFAGARTKAQALINQFGAAVAPRMYRLVAYTSDTLGDMAAAKQAMNTFLSKADSVDVLPADYEELANIDAKIPGSEPEAFAGLQKAIDKDSLMDDKVKFANKGVALAKKMNDKQLQSTWALIAYNLKKNPTNADLYNLGYTNYQAGNYKLADSLFCNVYEAKYPNEIFGFLWCAKSKVAQDDSLSSGALAEDAYKKLLDAATKQDSAKYRKFILESLFYLAGVSNNVKKDKEAAIGYLEKILAIDPTNATALQYIEILKKANKQPANKPKTGGASKSGSPPPK